MDEFQQVWHSFHPDTFPIGHLLKGGTGWNLTRFHLLPGGHTTAHTSAQLRGLLERFNTVATATLGEGSNCFIVALQSVNENKSHRARMERLKRRYKLRQGWQFFSTSDALAYTLWSGDVTWTRDGFNRLLLQVYRQDLWDIIFMNKATGAVFYAYEAGADVSQRTPQDLIALVSQFYGWMPTNGNGFLQFNPAQMTGVKFQVTPSCAAAINEVTRKAKG